MNIAALPRKKKTIYFEVKKRNGAFGGSHTHTKKTLEDEVTDNLPPSKEALNRAKLKKQKERHAPKNGGEIRRKVGIFFPLSRFVFLIHWAKAKHNSF